MYHERRIRVVYVELLLQSACGLHHLNLRKSVARDEILNPRVKLADGHAKGSQAMRKKRPTETRISTIYFQTRNTGTVIFVFLGTCPSQEDSSFLRHLSGTPGNLKELIRLKVIVNYPVFLLSIFVDEQAFSPLLFPSFPFFFDFAGKFLHFWPFKLRVWECSVGLQSGGTKQYIHSSIAARRSRRWRGRGR